MEWFRMYHDVLVEPRIQLLPIDVRWRWIECLCICSKNSDRGALPGLQHVAFYFKLSLADTEVVIEQLIDAGLIYRSKGSKTLRIYHWEKWQRNSDDEAAKKRRQRARDKSQKCPGTTSGPRTCASDSDSESETETDYLSSVSLSPAKNGKLETTTEKLETTTENEPPEFPASGGMFIVMPGDHPMDELDAREIWGAIWRAWKNPRICFSFYEHQQWVSKNGWLYAIKMALKTNGRPGSIRYLETIGVDFDVNGPKPERPVQRGTVGTVPYKPQSPPPVVVPMTEKQRLAELAESERLLAEYRGRMKKS